MRHALRLLLTGVPRLWRTARSAGAGRRDAVDVVLASLIAFSRAARKHPAQWRRHNAIRHFMWQAYLCARHGEPLARAVADAQEAGSSDAGDTGVDQANNLLGRAYGAAHGEELRARGRTATLASLAEVADRMWHDRELSAQALADGTDPRDARH
jgi:hypothetical protein